MTIREIDEVVQHTTVAGTAQKIYEAPPGEVLIIHRCDTNNTNTTAACLYSVWLDQDGGSSVSDGDASEIVSRKGLLAKEKQPVGIAGRRLAPGGQIYVDVRAADITSNFQSSVNFHISGVLVGQDKPATGTGA